MRSNEGFEIYLLLTGSVREPVQDLELLSRLAQLARATATEAETDFHSSGDVANCLQVIAESPVLFPPAIARWLGSEEDLAIGKALLHQVSVLHLTQRFPQEFDLLGLEEELALAAGRRLCALAAPTSVSLGWTLSLARTYPQSTETGRTVTQLLDYHVEQLPNSTLELLLSSDSTFHDLDASSLTLTRLQEDLRALEALPHLREFEMTTDMRLLYSSLKRHEGREIHRRTEEASVFRAILHTFRLKYSIRPIIERRGDGSDVEIPLEMSSHEVAVEIPTSELTDPIRGTALRNRLWRGDQS